GERGGGGVAQALALWNVAVAVGQADPCCHGGCRDWIRGGDHGAKYESHAPVKAGKKQRRGASDGDDSEGDQSERQEEDTDEVVGEFRPRGQPGSTIKKRRQDDEEDDVRIEPDSWDSRNETEQQAPDYHDDGIWNL